jgi:glycosyltransferase involved in cell wall biosynthesis
MGGPALHVSYLSRQLAARGYETILVAGTLSHGEGSMSHVAERLGVTVVELPALGRDVSPVNDFRAVRELVEIIRRERPTILHTHTAKAGAVGRVAARIAGYRPPIVVHTFHGHVLRGYFDPVTSEAYRRIERGLARHTDRLVAVSPEVRDDLVSLGIAPASKFEVIRLGIDLDARLNAGGDGAGDLRRLLGIPPSAFVVGWIGRMTAIKCVPDVIRAFAALRARGVDARLCLVGDGPTRRSAEQLAHDLGVVRETLFVGYQADVAPYYGLFDALLLMSANEGTPVVAIESLAAACPVVSTAVGGVADVVEDGVDGFLVAPGDAEAAGDRLAVIAMSPDRGRPIGDRGRARVRERYAVSRLVDDVDALYRGLLGAKRSPR